MNNFDHSAFRRLDLNLLVAFDALVTERSVTRAASKLCIGQPAMSHSLARLREILADQILLREGSGMVVTERAQLIAPKIRRLLQDIQIVVTPDRTFDPAQIDEKLPIALTDPLEALLLPALIARLRTKAPGLCLAVQSIPAWQQLDHLDKGTIRLAVGYFPSLRPVHNQTMLHVTGFSCLYNPALISINSPVTLEALSQLHHIHTSYTGDGPSLFDRLLQKRGLRRKVVAHTATPLSIPFILEQSALVAILPDLVCQLFTSRSALARERLCFDELAIPVSAVIHGRDKGDPLLAFMMKELEAVISATLGQV